MLNHFPDTIEVHVENATNQFASGHERSIIMQTSEATQHDWQLHTVLTAPNPYPSKLVSSVLFNMPN